MLTEITCFQYYVVNATFYYLHQKYHPENDQIYVGENIICRLFIHFMKVMCYNHVKIYLNYAILNSLHFYCIKISFQDRTVLVN